MGNDIHFTLSVALHLQVDVAVSPNVSLSNLVKSTTARMSDPTSHRLITGESLHDDPLAVCRGCPDTEGGGLRRGRKILNTKGVDELGCQVILQDIGSVIASTARAAPEGKGVSRLYSYY